MELFATVETMGHEQVVFFHSPDNGLKAIVAIHDTTLGPALGGLRMWPYASEAEALNDVLRLSRGMTYKAAVSGLNLGGGKSVLIGDPADKNEAMFRALKSGGRLVLVEYRGEDPAVAIKPLHKMTEAQIRAEIAVLGFEWVRTDDYLPQQHVLVFRKP